MAPEKTPALSEGELQEVQANLSTASLKLVLEELQYDEKCLAVHVTKVQNFHIRTMTQKAEWVRKRQDRAREAATRWWDSKARCPNQKKYFFPSKAEKNIKHQVAFFPRFSSLTCV